MLLDILSQSNYESYNVHFAKMFGLNAAVYLNLLLDINSKAIRKDKVSDSYFTIDRDYVESRTTLTAHVQQTLDKKFVEYGIFQTADDDKIFIDLNVLSNIIFQDETVEEKAPKKKIKQKLTKEEKREDLKTKIYIDCPDLYIPLCEWIDAIYAKEGWMSYKAVISGQQILNNSCVINGIRDIPTAKKIIDIATINGYRDMQWAVNSYKKDCKLASQSISATQIDLNSEELSEEVF